MATQLEEAAQAGVSKRRAVTLTPQASRLLEGPVVPTLLRLAAPTVALMLLQGVIAAGEAAFVGRLGSHALAGVSLSFPLVMLMTTLSAGAYGGGVASGVARALAAGRDDDATGIAGTALGMSAILGLAWTAAMLLFGRALYAALGATGPALEAAVLYSDIVFLGAVPFWLFNAAASVVRGAGNTAYPAAVGAAGGVLTLAISPLVIFGAGPLPGLGIAGAAWAIVGYNVVMAAVLARAAWTSGSKAKPGLRSLVPQRRYASRILRVAVPSAASTLLTNLTFIILTALVAPFGAEAIAGYGAGGRLEYLLIPIVFGVGSALVPLVAASDAAGDFGRVRRLTRAGAVRRRGVRAGRRHRRPVSVGVDGALHVGTSSGRPRHGLPGPGRPSLHLSRAGFGSLFRSAGAWADHAAASGHFHPALGRRGAGRPGPARLRLGDRLPVRPDGLRPRVLRGRDGGRHAPRARVLRGRELSDADFSDGSWPLRSSPGITSRFETKPENPRSHALSGNGRCAAPRRA